MIIPLKVVPAKRKEHLPRKLLIQTKEKKSDDDYDDCLFGGLAETEK